MTEIKEYGSYITQIKEVTYFIIPTGTTSASSIKTMMCHHVFTFLRTAKFSIVIIIIDNSSAMSDTYSISMPMLPAKNIVFI